MSKHDRSARARLGRLVALVCAAAMTLTGCEFSVYSLPLPGGADLGDNPYSVRVQFRDVLDLVPQSAVKVNDVTVGKVDEIELDGFHAEVTVLLHEDVKLPDNALAKIRQTSLLGEKFVSLESPATGASGNRLGEDDLIPLERSGRNPEVEEVLGAMSLLLNGGGVAQLKTISVELGNAFEGREVDIRSVLDELDTFMGQLDENKGDIIDAIESLNRLAISIKQQRSSIVLALDEMPRALASIDRQRNDLVKMLRALDELSSVGTEVIRQSKADTITSLQRLDPILTKLAEAGDALPNALQVFLTYPFVDAVVGENPQEARDLHMGDYTNLSVQMDIDLTKLPGPELPIDPVDVLTDVERCIQAIQNGNPGAAACRDLAPNQLDRVCAALPSNPLTDALCGRGGGQPLPNPLPDPRPTLTDVQKCANAIRNGNPGAAVCENLGDGERNQLCNRDNPLIIAFCRTGSGGDGGNGGGGVPDLPLTEGLGRAAPAEIFFGAPTKAGVDAEMVDRLGYDPTLGALLIQGMVQR